MRNPFRAAVIAGALVAVGLAGAAETQGVADYSPNGWGTFIAEVLRSLDVIGFGLLTLLVVLVGMFLDLLNHLRIDKLIPENLLGDVQEEMAGGEYEKALELCEKSDSLIGQVFAAALSKTDYSFERMEEAMRGEVQIQSLVWRQWVGQFRTTAVMGILLGCGGALINVMRFVADLAGRPNIGLALASSFELRAIVYNVLFALLLGCVMSVISLIAGAFCSSKLEKVMLEAERLGEELLDPFRPLPTGMEE